MPQLTGDKPQLSGEAFARRLAKGTIANIFKQILNVVGQIAIVPVLLQYWGNELYGEWQILAAGVMYISLLDFGMQTYATNRLNQCYARGSLQEFTRILHSALYFSLSVSALALLFIVPVVLALPLDRLFHLRLTDRAAATLACLFLSLQTIVGLTGGVIGGIYRAVGEYAREVIIANVYRLVILAGTLTVVMLRGGIVVTALLQLLALFGVTLFQWHDLRSRHPEIDIGLRERDRTLAWSFVVPSLLFLSMQVSVGLSFQGSTLLIGWFKGAAAVAVFVTLRTLVNVIPQVTASISGSLWPEFTALEAQSNYDALRKGWHTATKLLLCFAVCAAIFLHFAGEDVIHIWTRNRITYDSALMNSFLLLFVCESWYMTSSLLLSSSNRHRPLALCRLLSNSLGFGFGYFLCRQSGASGVVQGLLAADLMTCFWFVPLMASQMVGDRLSALAAGTWPRVLALAAVLYSSAWVLVMINPVVGHPERVVEIGVLVSVVGAASIYGVCLDRLERQKLKSFVPVNRLWRFA